MNHKHNTHTRAHTHNAYVVPHGLPSQACAPSYYIPPPAPHPHTHVPPTPTLSFFLSSLPLRFPLLFPPKATRLSTIYS
jgi:hypothetical protein